MAARPPDMVEELATHMTRRLTPETMKWMWGQGLFLYALAPLDEYHGERRHEWFLRRYYDSHLARGYRIESSDTAAPALGAYMLWRATGDERYGEIADEAAHYMRTAPRILDHLPNHMGTGIYSKIYPQSVWVDSIMMYGVFASRYAAERGDPELREFALAQTPLFADYLRDPKSGLFSHSYWTGLKRRYPARVFWGRGNGWVMAAAPLMFPYLPAGPQKAAAERVFKDLAGRLLPYQGADGFWRTVLSPCVGSYREASATALIASGLLSGARTGLLDPSAGEAGRVAYRAVAATIRESGGTGLELPGISAPTIPVPGAALLGYLATPKGSNLTYGLAALIFAHLEALRSGVAS